MIRHWIEAMRLRTLPVSVAGVIAGTGCAILTDSFKAAPALLCLIFAILAQIAANFGNEYYDFKNGIDRKGRVGFRRGVTEGEIAPKAMKTATLIYASHSHIAQDHILCHIMDWEISPLSFSSASCRSY
ncbi:MAG: hypothetical protein IJZ70_03300 [Bacteroidales bacterium]|nr:hypothetical protein [Bacteroidales bacterium]